MFLQHGEDARYVDYPVHQAYALGIGFVVDVWNQPVGVVARVVKEEVKELVLSVDDHVADLVRLAVQEGHQL